MNMNTCYVAMPFGVKSSGGGKTIDFNSLFTHVFRPAIEGMDLSCVRLDDMAVGTLLQKSLFSAILGSDLMIADVSTRNPNVMYELGIRHALRRGRTVIIMEAGDPVPFNISYSQVLTYTVDAQGQLTGDAAEQFSSRLRAVIIESQDHIISDSPLYEYFPDLRVDLPTEVATDFQRRSFMRRTSPPGISEFDPFAKLDQLRRYRDRSDWDQLVKLADELRKGGWPDIVKSPEVQRLLALALYRRGESGDQDRAISVLQQLIADTGGDGESYGLLGLIYKERYEVFKYKDYDDATAREFLNKAIEAYRSGFEKSPSDYYMGLNVVILLVQRVNATTREELDKILPQVRSVIDKQIASGSAGFLEYAASLQLAAVARDWVLANQAAHLARAATHTPWMLGSVQRDLAVIKAAAKDLSQAARLGELAEILSDGGADFAGARKLEQQILEVRRKVLGKDHPDTLMSMSNLAATLRAQGELVAASTLQRQVLDGYRRVLGEEHLDTLMSMSNLAATLQAQGELVAASTLQKQVLDGYRRVLGEEHLDTLMSMSNLAATLWAQGDLVAARTLQEQMLNGFLKVLGEDHPATMWGMSNLAMTLRAQGDLASARELEEKVLLVRRRVLGEEHPDTLRSMYYLGLTLQAQGELGTARALQEQVLAGFRRVLGEDHPDTLRSMNDLASTLLAQGNLDAARTLQEQVLVGYTRALGDDHPDTLTSMGNLAQTRQAQGEFDAARSLQERALFISRRSLGEKSPVTLKIMSDLAETQRVLTGEVGRHE